MDLNLNLIDKEHLVELLNILVEKDEFLQPKIMKIIRENGYLEIDLKKMKAEFREARDRSVGGPRWNKYNMRKLESNLTELFFEQFPRLNESPNAPDVFNYLSFLWQNIYNIALNNSDDGEIYYLIYLVESEVEEYMEAHNDLGASQRKVFGVLVKSATTKAAKDWNPDFWLEWAAKVANSQKQYDKVRETIDTIKKNSSYRMFEDVEEILYEKEHPNSTEEELDQRSLKDFKFLKRRLKVVSDEKQLELLERFIKMHTTTSNEEIYTSITEEAEELYVELLVKLGRREEAFQTLVKQEMSKGNPDGDRLIGFAEKMHFEEQLKDILPTIQEKNNKLYFAIILSLNEPELLHKYIEARGEGWKIAILTRYQDLYPLHDYSEEVLKIFDEGLKRQDQPTFQKNGSMVRGVFEVARVAGDVNRIYSLLDKWKKEYPRKMSLHDAIDIALLEYGRTKLRENNLMSEFSFGVGYTESSKYLNEE